MNEKLFMLLPQGGATSAGAGVGGGGGGCGGETNHHLVRPYGANHTVVNMSWTLATVFVPIKLLFLP